ncbi:MAG: hypothetical protein OXC65_01345 [Thiotrichales bacterium]|nr:hypothetical protein [Thiotrichales bacterium]
MSDTGPNPLDTVQVLRSAGVEHDQALAIAVAINRANERFAQKDSRKEEIASVRSEIASVRWVIRLVIALVATLYGALISVPFSGLDKLF